MVNKVLRVSNKKGVSFSEGVYTTLNEAIVAANPLLKEGIGVKILIEAGTYREDRNLSIDGSWIGGKAKDALLVIEGIEPGKVVFSGAIEEGWGPETWELIDSEKKVYRHDWPYNWGFVAKGWQIAPHPVTHRREMIFLNGKRLTQRLLEDYTFQDETGKRFDEFDRLLTESKGIRGGKHKHIYKGWKNWTILQPGEFGVAELGPGEDSYDGHPFPNSIFLRLPTGISSIKECKIEVSITPNRPGEERPQRFLSFLKIVNKNNVILRNLIVEKFSHYRGFSVISTNEWPDRSFNQNWLIENCEFRENGGTAISLRWMEGLSLRNVKVLSNGHSGLGIGGRNIKIQQLIVRDNNWHGEMARHVDHSTGGLSLVVDDAIFEDCVFEGNAGCGVRGDHTAQRIYFLRCSFNHNRIRSGAFFEIAAGPIVFKDCQFINNEEHGLLLLCVHHVTLNTCSFINNQKAAISGIVMKDRKTKLNYFDFTKPAPEETPIIGNQYITIQNCQFTGIQKSHTFLNMSSHNQQPSYFQTLLKINNNVYQHVDPSSSNLFIADRKQMTFEEWKKLSTQDSSSTLTIIKQ